MCSMALSMANRFGEHFAAGEGREGQRADELLRRRGHHHLDLVALLHQQARQFRGLISCDAAADRRGEPSYGLN